MSFSVCYAMLSMSCGQKYMPSITIGLDEVSAARAKIRRKVAVKTMETMTTLLEGVPAADTYDDMAADDRY